MLRNAELQASPSFGSLFAFSVGHGSGIAGGTSIVKNAVANTMSLGRRVATTSEHPLSAQVVKRGHEEHDENTEDNEVSLMEVQLGHILEVHPIEARYESERQEGGRYVG